MILTGKIKLKNIKTDHLRSLYVAMLEHNCYLSENINMVRDFEEKLELLAMLGIMAKLHERLRNKLIGIPQNRTTISFNYYEAKEIARICIENTKESKWQTDIILREIQQQIA